jgi:hypothetical protein
VAIRSGGDSARTQKPCQFCYHGQRRPQRRGGAFGDEAHDAAVPRAATRNHAPSADWTSPEVKWYTTERTIFRHGSAWRDDFMSTADTDRPIAPGPRLGALVVGAALLAGCATLRGKVLHGVGPDFQRPNVSSPREYRGTLGPLTPRRSPTCSPIPSARQRYRGNRTSKHVELDSCQ